MCSSNDQFLSVCDDQNTNEVCNQSHIFRSVVCVKHKNCSLGDQLVSYGPSK